MTWNLSLKGERSLNFAFIIVSTDLQDTRKTREEGRALKPKKRSLSG